MNLPGLSIFVPSCGLWQHVAKTPEVFTYDADGNISEYVSAADVSVAAHYDYSPFGEQLVASGPLASSFTHRFSTKPYCHATGFCEYQMRKYRPDIGRWMSRDPIGEDGENNVYLFCINNINEYDLGLFNISFDIGLELNFHSRVVATKEVVFTHSCSCVKREAK